MKHDGAHAGAFCAALVSLIFAGVITYLNRAAFTGTPLYAACAFVIVCFAFAVPADARRAASFIASYVPMLRGGSPPANPPDGSAS